MQKGEDGVYRWNYELNLFKNFNVLFLLYRIFILIGIGIALFVILISIGNSGFKLLKAVKVFALFILFLLALTTISYLIYAMLLKGKYCVVFEMDEQGIRHIQIDSQFKQAQIIAALVAITAGVKGNVTAAGIGLNAMSKNSSYSQFDKVRKIRFNNKTDLIILRQLLGNNQIYVNEQDFDFVLNYIRSHCINAK